MALPVEKVEIGFDLTESPIGPFFVLDDSVRGRLDNTEYRLGGTIFFDVTNRVKSFQIDRGKPRRFSTFPAGAAGIRFNNHDRAFDPTYPDSPFAGNIIPRREIRITSGTVVQFTGYIDDWNLTYTVDGNSVADAVAKDVTSFFSKQKLTPQIPAEQLISDRLNAVLNDSEVNWSSTLRDIETSTRRVGTQEIAPSTNALNYMQKVTETEGGGLLFINREGDVAFRNAAQVARSSDLVIFGQGTGIPYSGIQVVYGSELLYNEVVVSNVGGGTATAVNEASQGEYGIRNLSITDLLGANDLQSVDLAIKYADIYSEPEYRVERLDIQLHDLDPAEQEEILNLELGSVCKVEFTPNGIGDPIERFLVTISIKHDVNPEIHIVRLGFQEVKYLPLVLDDEGFGRLDDGRLAEGGGLPPLLFKLDDTTFGKLGIGTLG